MFFYAFSVKAQERDSIALPSINSDSIVIGKRGPDTHYREDQFYVDFAFNLMNRLPRGVRQSGFSGGVHLGFIRDIPLNKERNVGLGVGLGWSVNSYRTNLLISRDEAGHSIFQVLDRTHFDYKVNRFNTYVIEAPIQFRWRTSNAESYSFWRIYTGLRLGYIYYFNAKFKQPGKTIRQTKVDGLNRLRYGATFTFGYNTFNFTVYYSLNSFFDAKTLDGQNVDMAAFKIGLTFYIL